VFLFLYTDNFSRDYESMVERGVRFVREPKVESYGTVAVFEDCEGNLWDLLEPSEENKSQ
jgi:predicted enzyme related to lactoylglutathione lyase